MKIMKIILIAVISMIGVNSYAQNQPMSQDSTSIVPGGFLAPQNQTLTRSTYYIQGGCNPTYSAVTNSCISVAGAYGIPANLTNGTASFLKDSCTGALTYQSGCSAPPPTSNPVTSTISCASVAGSYGIPSANTVGSAIETKEGNSAMPNYGSIISVDGSGCSVMVPVRAPCRPDMGCQN